MTRWPGRAATPPRLPVPAAQLVGQVLRIPPRLARYLDEPITLRITRVREDISLWYDGDWIWLEGEQLDNHGRPLGPFQALVSVEAIPHGSR